MKNLMLKLFYMAIFICPGLFAQDVNISINQPVMLENGQLAYRVFLDNWEPNAPFAISVKYEDRITEIFTLEQNVTSDKSGSASVDIPYLHVPIAPQNVTLVLSGELGSYELSFEFPEIIEPTKEIPYWGAIFTEASEDTEFQVIQDIQNYNHFGLVTKLRNGLNPNYRDPERHSPLLIWAVGSGNLEAIRILLDHGADIHLSSPIDGSPTYLAGILKRFDILEYLISRGGNIDDKNDEKMTALFILCKDGTQSDVIKMVELGANIEERSSDNEMTPLMRAAEWGQFYIVDYLIYIGADVNAQAWNGMTALIATSTNGYNGTYVAQLLLEYGADPNITYNDSKASPLMMALKYGPYLDIARLLIEKGADVNAQDKDGHSVLDFARQYVDDEDFIDFLIAQGAS